MPQHIIVSYRRWRLQWITVRGWRKHYYALLVSSMLNTLCQLEAELLEAVNNTGSAL